MACPIPLGGHNKLHDCDAQYTLNIWYKSSAVAEIHNHLATIDMGRKVEDWCDPFSGESWVLT